MDSFWTNRRNGHAGHPFIRIVLWGLEIAGKTGLRAAKIQ
jgi:hypothetical protein